MLAARRRRRRDGSLVFRTREGDVVEQNERDVRRIDWDYKRGHAVYGRLGVRGVGGGPEDVDEDHHRWYPGKVQSGRDDDGEYKVVLYDDEELPIRTVLPAEHMRLNWAF